jgi:hypothetical protein
LHSGTRKNALEGLMNPDAQPLDVVFSVLAWASFLELLTPPTFGESTDGLDYWGGT